MADKSIERGDTIAPARDPYEKEGVVTKVERRGDGYMDVTYIDRQGNQAIRSSRVLCLYKGR